MKDLKIDLTGAPIPQADGDVNEYADKEAVSSSKKHNSDVDDVAVRYVGLMRTSAVGRAALKENQQLVKLLIRVMDEGWTSADEKNAISYLKSL